MEDSYNSTEKRLKIEKCNINSNILINRIIQLEITIDEQRLEIKNLVKLLRNSTRINKELHQEDTNCQSISELLRKLTLEWITLSSWTGPSKILRAKNLFQKFVWIFVFFLFMAATFYVLAVNINEYRSYTEVTTIGFVWQAPVQFPTITICNLNPFFIKILTSQYTYEQLNKYSYYSNFFGLNRSNSNDFFDFVNYQKLLAAVKYNLSQAMYLAAQTHGLNSLITYFQSKTLSCSFLGEPCNFQSDFSIYTETENLFCFKYNSNITNPKKINKAGIANAFQFSYFLDDSFSEIFTEKRGLRIYIHNQKRIYPLIFDDIQPGKLTNIALRLTYSQRLSSPYTNCIDDLTYNNKNKTTVMQYMFNVLNISSYSFKLCENIVFTNNLKQACDCMDKSYRMSDLPYICHTQTQINCMNSFRIAYSEDALVACPLGNLLVI